MTTPQADLDYRDIQGLVLREYRLPHARHMVLAIDDVAAAKRLLARWSATDASGATRITFSAPWPPSGSPESCLNVGLTWAGLQCLRPPLDLAKSFRSFPSFQSGAIGRAEFVFDVGTSAPDQWIGGLGPRTQGGFDSAVHIIVTLHARTTAARDAASQQVRDEMQAEGALRELSSFDGDALPGHKVHFGYRDGIAQPNIVGGCEYRPDAQPPAPACQFVLLDDGDYNVPEPAELGRHGSFAAFRIIEQDVIGFEDFLTANSASDVEREMLAAKIMGRWRNGTPLVLAPDAPTELPEEQLNVFDYAPGANGPGDPQGVRCPIGAHIRRVNPRGMPAPGAGSGHDHRLLRRGLPYGPEYLPGASDPQPERGLVGYFICADLFNQFEFVMQDWVNKGAFMAGLPLASRDPLIGANKPATSNFEILSPSEPPRHVTGFSSFARTRGAAYLFLPSLTALRYLAAN